MQIRCPHCDEIEDYADDCAWRKIPCKKCNRGFTATAKLIVGKEPASGASGRTLARAARSTKIAGLVFIGGLAVGNALLARAWLTTKSQLDSLNEGLEELDVDTGATSPGSRKGKKGGSGEKVDKFSGVKLVMELQAATIDELNRKVAHAGRNLERAENALERQKELHNSTKGKIGKLLKENSRLRREIDQYVIELNRLDRELGRGR